MELKDIRAIIDLMKKNDLAVFKLEKEGFKLELEAHRPPAPLVCALPGHQLVTGAPIGGYTTPAQSPPAVVPVEGHPDSKEIVSPMVGTFYRAPSPDSAPYVKEGQEIVEDSVVCIIEAMKVMNEIKAEVRGVITEVLVENGAAVQFGQPLFRGEVIVFNKVLIANRGEIALRIIRACKELEIPTVAVYSEADVDSLHVQLADEAVCIGRPPSSESYLKIDRIISAAEISDADAIHPGYGFLSENAHFAEVCASCNIKFIGPPPAAIRMMGDKNAAREQAIKAGVPISPGSDGVVETEQEALKVAKQIGYPVMIKAIAGGGGRGMRGAHNDVSLVQGFYAARGEAEKAFGNGGVYIEKLIDRPHHIEFQIIGDSHGRLVHLGERDCSIQRRNQKIVEESPSPFMNRKLRQLMGDCSVRLAQAVGYENAGTMEYLVDRQGDFYFMEMNTRIQVEHPITEEVYGCDLVKEQISIASGAHLSEHIATAQPRSHAIECRINAEDPANNFQPSPGTIDLYYAPGGRGVRVDSHAYSKYTVPPYYDSMIAKLICVGSSRESAIRRMARALSEYLISGIKTTIPFHKKIMQNPDFIRGDFDTSFVEKMTGPKRLELKL